MTEQSRFEPQIKVGQVWNVKDRLVMVSSIRSPRFALIGKAVKVGASYALVESPTLISSQELQHGTFVFDTEAPCP